jgi:hypothetical protein
MRSTYPAQIDTTLAHATVAHATVVHTTVVLVTFTRVAGALVTGARVPLALATLALVLVSANARGQNIRMVRLDESLAQVTLENFEPSIAVDVSSFQMCREPGTYQAISTLDLIAGSDLSLAPGEQITIGYGFIEETGSGIGLYVSGPFSDPANMLDYVQYKGATGVRENVAVAAGIWSAGTSIVGDGPYVYLGDGSQDGVEFWSPESALAPLPALGLAGAFVLAGALVLAGVFVLARVFVLAGAFAPAGAFARAGAPGRVAARRLVRRRTIAG